MQKIIISYKKACLLSTVFLAMAGQVYPVEIHPMAGTTSASFLKIGIGSRATAMGGAFSAVADDSTALYWNPAGLAQLNRQEIHITHNESFESIKHDFIGYIRPVPGGTAGLAVYGLYTPKDIERRSGLNESDPYEPISPIDGFFQSYDIAIQGTYARIIRRNLYGGASFKLIQQSIDTYNAFGAALDAGLLYRETDKPLTLALVAQHIGTPMKFIDKSYILPYTFKLGAAYKANSKLLYSAELSKPVDNFLFVSFGAEYAPIPLIALRAGYRYRWFGQETGDLTGLSAGFGFNYAMAGNIFKIDYAFLPFGALGNSNRLSFGIMFGQAQTKEKRTPAAKLEKIADKPQSKQVSAAAQETAPIPAAKSLAVSTDDGWIALDTKTRIKSTSSRGSIYNIEAAASSGSFVSLSGMVSAAGQLRNPAMEISEKNISNTLIKYSFRTNLVQPVKLAKITLRLPQAVQRISVTTIDGINVPAHKLSSDAASVYFQFTLDHLQEFKVEAEPAK